MHFPSIFFRFNSAIKATYHRLEENNGQQVDENSRWHLLYVCLSKHAFIGYCYITFLRFIVMSTAKRYPDTFSYYLGLDHFQFYLTSDGTFDANLVLFYSGNFIIFAFYHRSLYLRPNRFLWTLGHDLLTSTFTQFFHLNIKRLNFKVSAFKEARRKLETHSQNVFFNMPVVRLFPNLTPEARFRLNILLLLINLLEGVTFLVSVLVAILGILYYLTAIYSHEGLTSFFFAFELIDVPALAYIQLFGFENALFFVNFYPILALAFRHSTEQMEFTMKRQLDSVTNSKAKLKSKNQFLWEQTCLANEWTKFHRHHNCLIRYVMKLSREVSSPGFFTVFVCAFAFNVYALTSLLILRQQMEPINLLLSAFVLFLQSASFGIAFLYCIRITVSLHRFTSTLVCLQMALQGDRFVAKKLKLALLYERLQSMKKIGFSVGPFASVTWRAVFEFYFVYTSFILFFAKILMNF